MKFLIDENIPYAESFFAQLGQIQRFQGRELTAEDLIDVDVLLVRSITKVNDALLTKANALKFVGTATIGEDHIDKQLLEQRGIAFSSAPGCNANSVAEFVIGTLFLLIEKYQLDLSNKIFGVVGFGNIGKNLCEKLLTFNAKLMVSDPFIESSVIEGFANKIQFVDLETLLKQSDVISFHTPLTNTGTHPTYHMLNQLGLALLKDDVCLINASRGEVIDNQALLSHVQQRQAENRPPLKLVLDVWEGEPNPLLDLIPHCDFTSAHIAGYSLEGKGRGTEILYEKVCQLLGTTPSVSLIDCLPEAEITNISLSAATQKILAKGITLSPNNILSRLINTVFDVRRDDALFKTQLINKGFDFIRKSYPIRREWSSISVNCANPETAAQLAALGFRIK